MGNGKTNLVKTNRSTCWFTGAIATGTAYSSAFAYDMGDYALGTVCPSGTVPAAAGTHFGLQVQDYWGNWVDLTSRASAYSGVSILHPAANLAATMPPDWFNAVGSARLYMHDGTGTRVSATATFTFTVKMKS